METINKTRVETSFSTTTENLTGEGKIFHEEKKFTELSVTFYKKNDENGERQHAGSAKISQGEYSHVDCQFDNAAEMLTEVARLISKYNK